MKGNIVTSPELIRMLGKKLYTNRLENILLRELVQNAIDASKRSQRVEVRYIPNDSGPTNIRVADSGHGMSLEVLRDVFLSIGSSYKPGEESTGGFGIAKVALFCADRWSVVTNDHGVDHGLEFRNLPQRYNGTEVVAELDAISTYTYDIRKGALMLYGSAPKNGKRIIFNGKVLDPYKVTGRKEQHLTYDGVPFTVGTAPSFTMKVGSNRIAVSGYAIVRIHGLVQFSTFLSSDLSNADRNLVVDFNDIGYRPTEDAYPFSLSREEVDPKVQDVLQAMVQRYAKDSLSAFRNDRKDDPVYWENPRTGLVTHGIGKRYHPDLRERRVAKVWELVIKAMDVPAKVTFGVTNDLTVDAFHGSWRDTHLLVINAQSFLTAAEKEMREEDSLAFIMKIWHLACHELAHNSIPNHDEHFTSEEGRLAATTALNLSREIGKIRPQVRKIWGK